MFQPVRRVIKETINILLNSCSGNYNNNNNTNNNTNNNSNKLTNGTVSVNNAATFNNLSNQLKSIYNKNSATNPSTLNTTLINNRNYQNIINNKGNTQGPTYPTPDLYTKYSIGGGGNTYNGKGILQKRNPNNINEGIILDNNDPDLIQFNFTDLYNGTFIPFVATFTSLTIDNSAKWTPIKYIGRADRLFVYDGFERSINFSFCVYSSQANELATIWSKVNYLSSLTSPAGYTSGGNTNSFIIPPFVSITIGDLITNQPVALKNVNVEVTNEKFSWVLGPQTGGSYSFGSVSSGDTVAQVPMGVNISVSADFLEKEKCMAGALQFSDKNTWGNTIQSTGLASNPQIVKL